jgi:hypothetical protein
VRDRAAAGLIAAAVSGAPSTLHAVATGRDPLAAALAAGSVLLPRERRTLPLLAAGTVVHLSVSLLWASLLPRRSGALGGALFGLGIAALDLGVLARRFPRIRALPPAPQLADHALFGAIVGAYLKQPKWGQAPLGSLGSFRAW